MIRSGGIILKELELAHRLGFKITAVLACSWSLGRPCPDGRGCHRRAALALRADLACRTDLQAILYALPIRVHINMIIIAAWSCSRSHLAPCNLKST